MTARTHDLGAFTALNSIILTKSVNTLPFSTALVAIGACFIGGMTPDLDTPTSSLWQKIPAGTMVGKLLHPLLGGHRLISHSALGLIIFGWLTRYLLNVASSTLLVNMDIVWWAFIIGYLSHLIMDSLTTDGVPWLFPISIHFGFPPLKSLRIKTGGVLEKFIVFPGLLALNIYLIYTFYPFYVNLLRSFIR